MDFMKKTFLIFLIISNSLLFSSPPTDQEINARMASIYKQLIQENVSTDATLFLQGYIQGMLFIKRGDQSPRNHPAQ